MTYVSEGCSLALVSSNAIPVLLQHVANSNRSSASLLVVQSAIRILLNVTKVWTRNVLYHLHFSKNPALNIVPPSSIPPSLPPPSSLQWPSTCRSVFECPGTVPVVIDLMQKVHVTHPALMHSCCQLMHCYLQHQTHLKVGVHVQYLPTSLWQQTHPTTEQSPHHRI